MWAPPNCRDLIEDAVDDTLSERISVRQQYDPSRGDPIAWLVTIARHKLVDAVRAIARRRQHEVPLTDELARGLQAPPSICSDELAERRAWLDRHRRRFLAMAKTAQERRFLEVRLRGAPFDEQAVLLGAAHLPEAEQRALVNRVWQRLRVRLVRSLARSGHEPG
ncbi:MAG TPA: sigma factor [Steroidobacteraceae bacterium]|nr:sigma factor [Steroidobacteraceae bacterium]